ncbi:MAG: hypothetical protein JWN70_1208 [Planctomycetaceae bacterium]|nr:hypothetical protein [Planctomycetaceae bacterium]
MQTTQSTLRSTAEPPELKLMACCCTGGQSAKCSSRWLRFASGLLPICLLAAVPKCPACVAMYFSMGTGIGLSVTAASQLRLGMIVSCLVALGLVCLIGWRSTHRTVG